MMLIPQFRRARGWSQAELARRLGISSRGHVSDWETGKERIPAEQAIALDRLSAGELPVATLRPDLHDVRVIAAAPEVSA